jgi:hypothetical protein
MKLLFALFVLAMAAAAAANLGVELWDGRLNHHDPALRAIHYDTKYEISGQRRAQPAE